MTTSTDTRFQPLPDQAEPVRLFAFILKGVALFYLTAALGWQLLH